MPLLQPLLPSSWVLSFLGGQPVKQATARVEGDELELRDAHGALMVGAMR